MSLFSRRVMPQVGEMLSNLQLGLIVLIV